MMYLQTVEEGVGRSEMVARRQDHTPGERQRQWVRSGCLNFTFPQATSGLNAQRTSARLLKPPDHGKHSARTGNT